jgi:hypothetical protein
MPVHDWTRVIPGIFHHFHHDWISSISRALNAGGLPPGYYALAEQIAGGLGPDVLALEGPSNGSPPSGGGVTQSGTVALLEMPPKVQFTAVSEIDLLTFRKDRIAIHHGSNHDVVAMIEIVSPGNKASRHGLRSFVEKALELMAKGVHLLVIDLFPPGPRDPQGIHAAIWWEIEEDNFKLPANKPLTLASYSAGMLKRAFVEPVAVGDELPEMPLFLEPNGYVQVPLASTYQTAWEGVPAYWRQQLTSEPEA